MVISKDVLRPFGFSTTNFRLLVLLHIPTDFDWFGSTKIFLVLLRVEVASSFFHVLSSPIWLVYINIL